MAFDLASILKNDVSNLDTETIERIDLDLIDPDVNNFYSLDGLNELAANIELCGLMDPIRVRPTEGGRYTVISGHRRRAAIILIRDGGSDQFAAGVPCIVERGDLSPEMRELRLIYANANTRRISDVELGKQAERVTELLYKLKEQGVEFPGRMRDHVAQACQVSASKIARLKLITEGLGPELLPLWDAGKLTERLALELVKCPDDLKTRLVAVFKNDFKAIRPESLALVTKHWKNNEHYNGCVAPRKSAACMNCTHGNKALKHDLIEGPHAGGCYNKCCLKCDSGGKCPTGGWSCDYMCAKASAKRKDVKAAEDEKAEIKRRSRQDEVKAQMKESATRYLKAAEAAGLSDDVKIKFGYYEHSCPSVALIREYAAGDFGDRFFYKNDLDTNEIINMRETAKQLQCSADYLCGLTDELNPVSNLDTKPEWKEGTPSRIGRYFVKCVFDDDDDPVRMEVQWDGEEWTFRDNLDSFLFDAGLTVLCWWPLPDD